MWHPSVFALVYFIHGISGSILKFQGSPANVKDGLTASLRLHCSLNDTVVSKRRNGKRKSEEDSDNVGKVTAMLIVKNGAEVASVRQSTPPLITDEAATDGHVSGSVKMMSTVRERSFIDLQINNPSTPQVGEYACQVNAVDKKGQNVVYSTSIEITISQPTTGDLINYIRDWKEEIKFSAALRNSATLPTGRGVVYDEVYTNIGEGYNSSSGEFICPRSGYYELEFSALGENDVLFWLALQHNKENIVAIHGSNSVFHLEKNSAIVKLVKDDVARIVTLAPSTLHSHDPATGITSFSGRLLSPV